ncbi:MAG: dihydroorotate dehydrogenase [Tissierellia bacterium]|nr:dihydroorotate dehydrogenase [Tissierellia bacterium]
MNRLKTELCGVEFKNPVFAASGTFGYGEEYSQYYDPSIVGGLCSKGLTLHPKSGNEGIRIWETPAGIMNSIGLENPGVKHFVEHELERMKSLGTKVIVNIGGNSIEEYIEGVEILNEYDFDILELNISCPNVKSGGMAFGIKCDTAEMVVSKIKPLTKHPLMVKLSPNAENIVEMAKACESAGADALSLVNTFQGMAIDVDTRKIVFENVYAGLSGPAIKPIALRMVHQVCKAVDIPVVGLGGIMNYKDALEFIMAGATAVQIGTANFVNPNAIEEIIRDLDKYLLDNNIQSIAEIRGIL